MKAAFEQQATREGMAVSAWLRWLGERELDAHAGLVEVKLMPREEIERVYVTNGTRPGPAASVFIPGYGLEEEEH